jgi:hypothetical protein
MGHRVRNSVFLSGYITSYSSSNKWEFQAAWHSNQHLILSGLLILAILLCTKWFETVVLIFISLITNDALHHPMCSVATHRIFFLMKNLFNLLSLVLYMHTADIFSPYSCLLIVLMIYFDEQKFSICFKDRISLCGPEWPGTCDLPASASWILSHDAQFRNF